MPYFASIIVIEPEKGFPFIVLSSTSSSSLIHLSLIIEKLGSTRFATQASFPLELGLAGAGARPGIQVGVDGAAESFHVMTLSTEFGTVSLGS